MTENAHWADRAKKVLTPNYSQQPIALVRQTDAVPEDEFLEVSAAVQKQVTRDFAPISLITSSPYVLLVHPASPYSSVRDLIAAAKAKPGALNFKTS